MALPFWVIAHIIPGVRCVGAHQALPLACPTPCVSLNLSGSPHAVRQP